MTTFTAAPSGTIALGDMTVHRMGFGAMRITGTGIWGPPADHDESIAVLRRAVDLGVTFIDTADSYGPFVSEDLIREALHPYADATVIATKGGLTRHGPDLWLPVGRPEYLRQCVEMSLRRLGVDRIDLWQLHRIDPAVPEADQFGEIAAMVAEGKIRHVGLSEVDVATLGRAQAFFPVVSVQNRYSLTAREHEDVLTECEAQGIAFIPWAPLDGGALTAPGGVLDRIRSQHQIDGVPATQSQVVLAWLLHHSPVMLPIPGTSKVDHLEQNIAAASLTLSAEELANIDSAASTI